MAKVYRDYLEKNEVLTEVEDNGDGVELFLETFGAIDTTERMFGVPVDVKKALTSFDDAKTMINDLSDFGITNLSIKYRGWSNGGLDANAPTKIDVVDELGGKGDLVSLIKYANERNIKIFPDFDYTYISNYSFTDKFDAKDDTVKTVDNRSAVHRTYDPVLQYYVKDGSLIISPNKILGFWRNIEKTFSKLGTGSVSFATLGSELNSDHNKDDSLNRENSKTRISEFLAEVKSKGYDIMVDQGNSYTFAYANNILNVPLDSSNRYVASESVPFIGMVLHGYKTFAGEAINLAGDYTYNVLKTVENGAVPYFILSYKNQNTLKTSKDYSKYYSIRYNIWLPDLVETYQTLDLILEPVKDVKIDNHEFVNERRVIVTYANGISYEIDYSTNVLSAMKDGTVEYTIDFEQNTVTEGDVSYTISEYLAKNGYEIYSEKVED